MKTERRHELQQNTLADWLGRQIVWAEQNVRLIIIGLVGVVIGAGLIAYWNNSRAERRQEAWSDYLGAMESRDSVGQTKALESVANNASDLPPGQMADILLADIALNQGIDQLKTDRAAAEKKLNEAKKRYSDARNAASDQNLKDRATLGLARFYETMGLLEEATKEYRTLADSPASLYQLEAERKIDYLSKPATIMFAKWYRKQKLEPAASASATARSVVDKDEIGKLPADESSFPGAGTATSSTTPSATPGAAASATAKPAATPSATPTASPTPSPTPSPTATAK